MQIGQPGGAYGPSQVMSRPTMGRGIVPLPRAAGGVAQALMAAKRMPAPIRHPLRGPASPGGTHASVLQNELARRLALRSPQTAPPATYVGGPGAGAPGYQLPLQGLTAPLADSFADPLAAGQTSMDDPSMLLARARLSALMGS